MAIQLNTFAQRFSLLLVFGAFLLVAVGCGTEHSPVVSTVERDGGIPNSEFQPIAFLPLAPAGKLAQGEESGSRSVTDVIGTDGGQLKLDWAIKSDDGNDETKVIAEIKIFAGALDEAFQISISLLNAAYAMVSVDLEFGNHGTQFNIPAEVTLDLQGLDLSGHADPEAINFYWYDPDTDAWYPVPRDEDQFKVEVDGGKVWGIWYFEHFSRYSLSKGR